MSLIPQRKKTPEELAALREKDLSYSTSKAKANAESLLQPMPSTAQSSVIRHESRDESTPPVRSRRRNLPLRHGTPHLFDGLRPQEASNTTVISLPTTSDHAALPTRKHSEGEILQMRRRDAFQTRPPIEKIRSMALHPVLAGFLYLLLLAVVILTKQYWDMPAPQRWLAPSMGCSLLFLFSGLIYFKKPRSRHHAAILFGVATGTLIFCLLINIKNTHAS